MKFLAAIVIIILGVTLAMPWIKQHLPAEYNPFTPLAVTDPPNIITRYKLRQLATDPQACLAVMERARDAGLVSFSRPGVMSGQCPLENALSIQRYGDVQLSSRFLASCPLAVSSVMFVLRVQEQRGGGPLASPLARIDHLGSYACRNIYHRAQGRLSEHATADAWDIAGFQLKNGQRITVLNHWQQPPEKASWLHQTFQQSCNYFGNSLGPDYNAAHANHFHLGMRGFGVCR
ncbi:extensin-like domain-containing protein [Winslowiella arboricola]